MAEHKSSLATPIVLQGQSLRPLHFNEITSLERERSYGGLPILSLLHPTVDYVYNSFNLVLLAGKPVFGKLPCSGATMTAHRRLSADASMLCDVALMPAKQYAGICGVMCAWHVSMQGEH